MLILGKNSDDKGTQLENLTRSILFTLGYTNIVANEIRSGAEEIDVSAERQFPAIRGVQVAELICECKAYKKPVDINDWLKFLGKLFTAEKCQSQTVYGCFVALNGVKGSVAGHYKNLASHTNIITLVSGEDLFKRVSEIYNLCDLKKVKIAIQSFTNRQVISFEEVAYYENQVFRIIIFEKDAYTIFCSDGQPINKEIYNSTLREAAEFVLPTMNFIDLQEEAEALRKAIRIEKMVLSQLFLDGGRTTGSISHTDEFTESEVCNAINNCIEKSWITRSGSSEKVYLVSENDENYYVILADIYRFLFFIW